jgi:hypothetical protein
MTHFFRTLLGDDPLPVNPQCFQITIRGARLQITPATIGFTPVPENTAWERSALRGVLPAWHGKSVTFWRRHKR